MACIKSLLELLCRIEARLAACWARAAHRRLRTVQWSIPPLPRFFEHRIDLYDAWLSTRNPQWLERGIYAGLCIRGGRVLELCCGDGFNARNFYSIKAETVVACDFDAKAIARAQRQNAAPNLVFVIADIRNAMPEGSFDTIVWDASMDQFSASETRDILGEIRQRLGAGGILAGHVAAAALSGKTQLPHNVHEIRDASELSALLHDFFTNVRVFETRYLERRNLYFWASAGAIPFNG